MQTAEHWARDRLASAHHTALPLSKRRPQTSAVRRSHSPPQPIMWESDGNACQMFKLTVASSAVYFQQCHSVRSQATVGDPRRGYLVWDAAMSRGICPRVNSCGSFWILSAVIFTASSLIDVDAYSCHEVKTAFQLRQVGPLHRVPETPGTGEPVGLAPLSEEHFG